MPTSEETYSILISRAGIEEVPEIAVMVGELLEEIMNAINIKAFDHNYSETNNLLIDFLCQDKYFVFVATACDGNYLGFISLYESHALYAGGSFGTIAELYVRPDFRNRNIGLKLVSSAKSFGFSRNWKRLEVTTPPLPEFDKTLAFYEREGFAVSGGRKLKIELDAH
ncbi:acetyltransferase [Azospira sp. I13]|nr:acetyltransferase [Azospira sp. I13]